MVVKTRRPVTGLLKQMRVTIKLRSTTETLRPGEKHFIMRGLFLPPFLDSVIKFGF